MTTKQQETPLSVALVGVIVKQKSRNAREYIISVMPNTKNPLLFSDVLCDAYQIQNVDDPVTVEVWCFLSET